jgi:hypothetical protein
MWHNVVGVWINLQRAVREVDDILAVLTTVRDWEATMGLQKDPTADEWADEVPFLAFYCNIAIPCTYTCTYEVYVHV